MASWLHRRISKEYPVEVSSKSIHPSQSCDVKFDPLIISLQRNVKPMVKMGFSCQLAREPEKNAKNSLVSMQKFTLCWSEMIEGSNSALQL